MGADLQMRRLPLLDRYGPYGATAEILTDKHTYG
jgi:hypothetical protein